MRALAFCLMFVLGACAPAQKTAPTMAAGIAPVARLAERIGGEPVPYIIPQGSDPHGFSLKASDAALLENAAAVLSVNPLIDGAVLRGGANEHILFPKGFFQNGKHGHDHSSENAHYWLSLVHSKDMAFRIAEIWSGLKPEKAAFYQSNARAFAAEVEALAQELQEAARGKNLSVMQQHPAWDYFLAELGINSLGSAEAFEGDQISPSRLARAVRLIKAQPHPILVDDIFTAPSPILTVLQKETGASYYSFNPMAAENGKDDILSILRFHGMTLLQSPQAF